MVGDDQLGRRLGHPAAGLLDRRRRIAHRIVVAGVYTPFRRQKRIVLAAYGPSGALDAGFSGDGIAQLPPRGNVVADPVLALDGSRPVIGGTVYSDGRARLIAGRLTPEGEPDESFGEDGVVGIGPINPRYGQFPGVHAVAPTRGGGVLAAGSNGPDFFVAAWNDNGRRDRTFSQNGRVTTDVGGSSDSATGLAITLDGVVAGGARIDTFERQEAWVDLAIVRYRK